jgi:hypothetical protein
MITSNYILSSIRETLGDDRFSSFTRDSGIRDYKVSQTLDSEECFEWSEKDGNTYTLILEKTPIEPGRRVIFRKTRNEVTEEFGYYLLKDYPTLPEVLFAYGRLIREAREQGIEGIAFPDENIWKPLNKKPDLM